MRMAANGVLGAAALILAGTGASAECGPIMLESVPGTRQAYFHDHDGSGGPSAGDKRGGHRQVRASDGERTGTAYWINTVRAVGADGVPQAIEVELVLALDDGVLFVTQVHESAVEDYHLPETTTVPPTAHWSIHGGTGAYADASGTVEITFDDDGESSYDLDLACE
ncbi:MAG: hypothetical protein GY798_34445 [Hyphomicrobiales bacterium]|nr:hypothetical protein [Hyphomicrobiales bacterium]